MWQGHGGNHADRRVSVFLELPGVRRAAEAQAGRLLRFLQLRQHAMPAGAGGARLLHLSPLT
jgi:hypothetical protein